MTKRKRGLVERVIASGVLQALGLDLVAGAGVTAIGVGIYQIEPAAVWIYGGAVLVAVAWMLGKTRHAD